MSTNQWRKRQSIVLQCPDGSKPIVRRPGPDLALKAGKIARIFQKQDPKEAADVDKQLDYIAGLPDGELQELMNFARVLLCDVVQDPPLSLHPKEAQLSPDDLPLQTFWFIFTWAMNGGPDMPVQLADGEETTVEAVGTFPSGQDASDNVGEDSPAM